MNKLYLFILLGIIIISCNGKTIQDLPLEIEGYDTTVFKGGNFRYLGTKYRMSDQNNFVLIQQELELYWFDIEKDSMVRSINLDTTDLVLPEVKMLQALYQEADSTLVLFFPQRNKIVHLNSKLEIEKEVNLSGIQELTHMYMPYGQVFYYNPSRQEYYIGLLSAKLEDHRAFVNETRFIGIFDGNSGKLKTTFGEFSEERKKIDAYVHSEGLINFDVLNDEFYIRETVGSSTINKYSKEGKLENSYDLGSSFLSYKIFAKKDGEEWFQTSKSDHNYGMKVASPNRIVSFGMIFKDERLNKLRNYGILFVEDLINDKTYSTPVDPYQMIILSDDFKIYLVRSYPKTEEIALVKLKYKLGEPTQD